MDRSRSIRCASACLAWLMNASNVLSRFGASGNRPSGSANVSSELWLVFGRRVCGCCCCCCGCGCGCWGSCWDAATCGDTGEGWCVGGAGKLESRLAGRISFCSGCRVVAFERVEIRFMFVFGFVRGGVGGRVTGAARLARGLRRKRWNLENIVFVLLSCADSWVGWMGLYIGFGWLASSG
jgi:hypothetical protein